MTRNKVLLLGIAPVALVIFGSITFINFPSKGRVSSVDNSLSVVKGDSISLKKFATTYIDIEFPDNLTLKTSHENKESGIYAQYMFADTRFASKQQSGVTLAHLNGLTLEEIPFVKQRAIHPELYTQLSITQSSVTFRSKSGDEYMTTSIHGDDYVTIASSGTPEDLGALRDMTDVAIRSLRWR